MTQRFLTLQQQARRRFGALVAIYGLIAASFIITTALNARYVNVPAVAIVVVLF